MLQTNIWLSLQCPSSDFGKTPELKTSENHCQDTNRDCTLYSYTCTHNVEYSTSIHSLITTRRHWDASEMTTAWLTTLLLLYTTAFSLTHIQGSALSAYTPKNQCRKVSLIHIYPFMLEIHVCVYYRIGVGNFLILDSLRPLLVHFHVTCADTLLVELNTTHES